MVKTHFLLPDTTIQEMNCRVYFTYKLIFKLILRVLYLDAPLLLLSLDNKKGTLIKALFSLGKHAFFKNNVRNKRNKQDLHFIINN